MHCDDTYTHTHAHAQYRGQRHRQEQTRQEYKEYSKAAPGQQFGKGEVKTRAEIRIRHSGLMKNAQH